MNIHRRIEPLSDEDEVLARIQGFISPEYGERGPVGGFQPGAAGEFAGRYEDRTEIHECDLPVSVAQILALLPRLRSRRWLACLGLGQSFLFGTGFGDLERTVPPSTLFYARERLQIADRAERGYLLTCDHRVYDLACNEPLLQVRLKWHHSPPK